MTIGSSSNSKISEYSFLGMPTNCVFLLRSHRPMKTLEINNTVLPITPVMRVLSGNQFNLEFRYCINIEPRYLLWLNICNRLFNHLISSNLSFVLPFQCSHDRAVPRVVVIALHFTIISPRNTTRPPYIHWQFMLLAER